MDVVLVLVVDVVGTALETLKPNGLLNDIVEMCCGWLVSLITATTEVCVRLHFYYTVRLAS